ncbi:glycosyltransferase [Acidisoma sp. 7E03]
MLFKKVRRNAQSLRTGLLLLTKIHGRHQNLAFLAKSIVHVGVRKGAPGLRQWIINTANVAEPEQQLPAPSSSVDAAAYRDWLDRYDISKNDHEQAATSHHAKLALPELLVLAVVGRDDVASIEHMLASWRGAIHADWQGAIVASSDLDTSELQWLQAAAGEIPVITLASEVEKIRSRFRFVLLTFGSVLLNKFSTYMFLQAATTTGAAIVYSDHDLSSAGSEREAPCFKPQFSPQYLTSYNYVGDCLLISEEAEWDCKETETLMHPALSERDDWIRRLMLRTWGRDKLIEHLPFILFHLRKNPCRMHKKTTDKGSASTVSIILRKLTGLEELRICLDGILENTSYEEARVEIVVVDNGSNPPELVEFLNEIESRPNLLIVRPNPSSGVAAINAAARDVARGDVLVFLDGDANVIDPEWLAKIASIAQMRGVGAVGSKVLSPDGALKQAGSVAGGIGTAGPLLHTMQPAIASLQDHTREMSLPLGACLAIRREIFLELGGFDQVLITSWGDIKLCLSALSANLRNIYIADALLSQRPPGESLTETREIALRGFSEADYTCRRFRNYFYDDPFYNPNKSLQRVGALAEPPRVRMPWLQSASSASRILMLSLVYKVGYGVPVVMQQHAKKLVESGYEVVIGGPAADEELSFPGCVRVNLTSAEEAAAYAFRNGVALIVSHTPPFFEVSLLVGSHIPVLAHDHGEPPVHLFQGPTRDYLVRVGDEKRRAAVLAAAISVISQSVKEETLYQDAIVVENANSHLAVWSETYRSDRDRLREKRGWKGKFVVLTVCRFHEGERAYKGLDKIAEILREFPYLYPNLSPKVEWVLAGAGTAEDVKQVEALGFKVYPNVSNATLADLYKMADAYMSFSKWEGYNLGIGQALAMGLPVLASDIPAHREFGIKTTHSVLIGCEWLADQVKRSEVCQPVPRMAKVTDWNVSAAAFVKVVEDTLQEVAQLQGPRGGASVSRYENT